MLVYPYVQPAEFRRHPTFLDSNNLVTGGTQQAQDAALFNALLTASQWADDKADMPLGAHVRTERTRLTPSRTGQLRYHPEHAPVIAVTGMSVGATPDSLDQVADPQVWTEHDGRIIVAFSPSGGPGLSSLQFGSMPAGGEALVSWTYVAGYPSTQLTAPASADTTTLTVRDTTGITAGTVMRLWTPGLEEAVTVASVAGSVLTLTGGLAYAHVAGGTCSALPTTARQAIINYAVLELMRPASAAEQTDRGPAISSTAGDKARVGSGMRTRLYDEACKLLKPFKRVR